MKLWHCAGARSLRPLWALEEMGLEYELELLPFPPRMFQRDYLEVNSLGTVPFLQDGETEMTESSAICQYLVDRYEQYEFGLRPEHPEYGAYLNWLHHADATLTFPQTLTMRYYYLEPTPEKQAVGDDYAKWFIARLRRLDEKAEIVINADDDLKLKQMHELLQGHLARRKIEPGVLDYKTVEKAAMTSSMPDSPATSALAGCRPAAGARWR